MRLQSAMRRWEVITGICAAIGVRTVVEIGSKEGRFARFLLENLPDTRLFTVDPWEDVMPNAMETYETWNWDAIKAEFRENTGNYSDRHTHYRMRSAQAVDLFAPRQVDLVFIDGAHDFSNVDLDIKLWWPIISDGGFMAGHDYQHKFPGVHCAVAQNFDLMRVAVMADSVWTAAKNGGAKL